MDDTQEATGEGSPAEAVPEFHAVLRPNRSLSRQGFVALMAAVGAVSFAAGLVFVSLGAWPVFGFFGLDVALIYVAFRLNYRSGRLYETVDLSVAGLEVARVHPDGRREAWAFEPYWVKVDLQEEADGAARLALVSHGRRMRIGAFLSPAETAEFARALARALGPYKAL